MIKKLLLTLSFIILLTISFSITTYAAEEGKKIVVSEELANTLNILNNLYKEGVITDEEFSSAKSMLLDPIAASGEKTKKNLTAAERKRLKDAEANKLKAQKKVLKDEKLAEKERIKQARLEKSCLDAEYKSSDTTLHCSLLQIQTTISEGFESIKTSNTDKTSKGDWLKCTEGTAAERKAAGICQ